MEQARWQCSLVVLIALLSPALAHAEATTLFSPGPLSSMHQKVDGPGNCTKCHAAGGQVSMARCYDCHSDVKTSVANKTGLHGHIATDKLACENCHHEHLGTNNTLLPWRQDRSDFDHRTTGWPLRGAHAKIACETCHKAKYASGKVDYTGLQTACVSCHFDEHRGQEKGGCESCHSEKAWKPAPYFDHDTDSAYALTGKHRTVPCAQCHPSQVDTTTTARAKPAPLSMTFAKFVGIKHEACTDCHTDPHNGKLGSRCLNCHTTQNWAVMAREAKDTGFHSKTRFPLEGLHADVPCKSCHGPWGNQPAVFHDMRFGACEDCHVDAHMGQMPASPKHRAPACRNCHTVDGFTPPDFDVSDHDKTAYPLEGAHAVTPCQLCHVKKESLAQKVPKDVRERLRHEGRDLLISLAELDIQKPLQRCDSCHASPHAGQFITHAAAGCTDCHDVESFRKLKFDHNKDSRFPLTGVHATTPCAGCHTPQQFGEQIATLYRPIDPACATCHRDVHVGQFSSAAGVNHCEKCHDTETFKKANLFNHNDPKDARFPLEGTHAALKCGACHTQVPVDKHTAVKRYIPLPITCDGCHEDYHNGRLNNVPGLNKTGSAIAAASEGPACSRCHTPAAWMPADFTEHDDTTFLLNGAHRSAPCEGCHVRNFTNKLPTMCEACHREPHVGEFGTQCEACHNESNWSPEFDVDAHRVTNFPLVGAHGALPCQECHQGFFMRNFRGTTVECIGCHQQDYLRAGTVSINHVASGFSYNCRQCHESWAFQRGVLLDHENTFHIYVGVHNGITCLDCHTSLAGGVYTNGVTTGTAACTGCHIHTQALTDPRHKGVAGYQYVNALCYPCHKTVQ